MGILSLRLALRRAFIFWAVAGAAHATADTPQQAASDNAEQVQQQQQQRRDAQDQGAPQPPQGAPIPTLPILEDLIPPTDGPCVELRGLEIAGSRLIDAWDLEVIEAPFIDRCITPALAQAVIAATTNYYLNRGFFTTRAYLPEQDLSDGYLRVWVGEGQVETPQTSDSNVFLANTFEADPDLPLNLRDLEQAVDQLNAVPGQQVRLQVMPGEQADHSRLQFNAAQTRGVEGRLSYDNTGTPRTGQTGASVMMQAGNLFNRNEIFSVYYRESTQNQPNESASHNVSLRIPHGYNTYQAGFSKGEFTTLLTFPITGTQLENTGANTQEYVQASRVIFRDQRSKHSLQAKLKRDSVESYIAGERMGVSSRALKSVELSSHSVWGLDTAVLSIKPEIQVGLDEVNNLPEGANTPREYPQAEYLRYKLSLNYSRPLEVGSRRVQWTSNWVGQHASVPLYGSQQLTVGGPASVRGSHDVSISGDRGYFWQNTLMLPAQYEGHGLNVDAQFWLGYDFGRVQAVREGAYEGGMEGAVIGAKFSLAPVSLTLSRAMPLSISGRDEGNAFTTAVVTVDF